VHLSPMASDLSLTQAASGVRAYSNKKRKKSFERPRGVFFTIPFACLREGAVRQRDAAKTKPENKK